MKLANPFPPEVRLLFLYVYSCWECGRSDLGLELHHIWGRISGSALNAAPICPACHNRIKHDIPTHRRLFKKTIDFLALTDYKTVPADADFLDISTVQKELDGFVWW